MPLMPDQVVDWVNTLLPEFKKYKWKDISLTQQKYMVAKAFRKGVRSTGGLNITWTVQHTNQSRARNIGLFAKDVTGVEDLTKRASVPWTIQTTNWSFDELEPLFQSDATTIVDDLKIRDHSAANDMTRLNEDNWWSAPASSSDNRPRGITYWAPVDTTSDGDFSTALPDGHTEIAGIIPSAVAGWRHWAFGYDVISKGDFVKKFKRAVRKTHFETPNSYAELNAGTHNYEAHSTTEMVEALEELAEQQNDRLGKDLAPYMDSVMIGRVPVSIAYWLDANTTNNPIYAWSWSNFHPRTLRGAEMRRKKKSAPRQHNVHEVHIDNVMGFECVSRRELFVGAQR